MPTRKTSRGRQRVEMTKINNKSQLQVTFSKRCAGLFKKASELCTLCGVEMAIIVFSPAGKPFSFGHPSVESIIDKFSKRSASYPIIEPHSPNAASAAELNNQIQRLHQQQETEKVRAEKLDELRHAGQNQFWWEAPVDELGLEELQQLQAALEELKKNVLSAQVGLLASNPSPLTVNTWGDVTPEATFSAAESSDDAYNMHITSYHFPAHSYEAGFY